MSKNIGLLLSVSICSATRAVTQIAIAKPRGDTAPALTSAPAEQLRCPRREQ